MQDALVDTVSVHTAMYSVHTVTVRMVRCSAHTATVRMVRCSVRTVTVHMAKCSVHTATVRMVKCSVRTATVHTAKCAVRTVTVRMMKYSVHTATVHMAIDYIDYSTVVSGQPAVNFPPALELTAVNTLTAPVSVAVNSPTEQLLHNADKKPLFHHTVCRKMYIA